MTDSTAAPAPESRPKKDEIIEDAVVVDDATGTPIVVEEATTSASEPVMATDDPTAEAWHSHVLYDAGIPYVSAKLFARADAGEIAFVVPDAGTACLACATGMTTGRYARALYRPLARFTSLMSTASSSGTGNPKIRASTAK